MNAELNLTIKLTYRTDRLTGKRTSFFSALVREAAVE